VTPRTALALAAALAAADPAAAQTPTLGPPGAAVGISAESYHFSEPSVTGAESITLVTAPFSVRVGLGRATVLEVAGGYAYGVLLRSDGGQSDLRGPLDTDVRLARTFGRDRVTLAVVGTIPTGRDALTGEEADVADAVSADLLPFRVSHWGSGGGVGATAAVAIPVGGGSVGLSGGYVAAREYEPFREDDAGGDRLVYRPGNHLVLRGAADHRVGRAGQAALAVTWQRYDDDRLAGRNLYRAGDRLQAVASLQGAVGPFTTLAYAGLLHRERGTSLDEASPGAAVQDLWLGGVALRSRVGPGWITWVADGRLFRSDDGRGQGHYGGAGATAELPAGPLAFLPGARLRFGSLVVDEESDTPFGGVELTLTMRYRTGDGR
jgi:hypothetical protein